jgi:hypothetical protein
MPPVVQPLKECYYEDRITVITEVEMTAKKQARSKGQPGPLRDVLDLASLLSSSTTPGKAIETVLMALCERLGKRARCALVEGKDLKLRFWAGVHSCPIDGVKIHEKSVVWDAVMRGKPINIVDSLQTKDFMHTLGEPITIKAVIPLSYVDPLTNQNRNIGALIVDSGQDGVPISTEDFEYLQVIGQLVSAIFGRTELVHQLMESCRRQEAILMETVHNFRNSIAIIGGFSRRVAKLAQGTELADSAIRLQKEVGLLEAHLAKFEQYMNLKT